MYQPGMLVASISLMVPSGTTDAAPFFEIRTVMVRPDLPAGRLVLSIMKNVRLYAVLCLRSAMLELDGDVERGALAGELDIDRGEIHVCDHVAAGRRRARTGAIKYSNLGDGAHAVGVR